MADSTRWISVGELSHAFAADNNTPRATDDLAGKTLGLHLENGQTVEHRFSTGTELQWTVMPLAGTATLPNSTVTLLVNPVPLT